MTKKERDRVNATLNGNARHITLTRFDNGQFYYHGIPVHVSLFDYCDECKEYSDGASGYGCRCAYE